MGDDRDRSRVPGERSGSAAPGVANERYAVRALDHDRHRLAPRERGIGYRDGFSGMRILVACGYDHLLKRRNGSLPVGCRWLVPRTASARNWSSFHALQEDPERLKSYFLKGYTLFPSLVVPITMACALFAEDIIRVFLGPKWGEAAPVFRMLAPAIFAFKLINPFGWFMQATGRATRSLYMGVLLAPIVILGYIAGLPYGAIGVYLSSLLVPELVGRL